MSVKILTVTGVKGYFTTQKSMNDRPVFGFQRNKFPHIDILEILIIFAIPAMLSKFVFKWRLVKICILNVLSITDSQFSMYCDSNMVSGVSKSNDRALG